MPTNACHAHRESQLPLKAPPALRGGLVLLKRLFLRLVPMAAIVKRPPGSITPAGAPMALTAGWRSGRALGTPLNISPGRSP